MTDHTQQPSDGALDAAADWLMKIEAAPLDHELRAALARWRASSPLHEHAWRRVEKMWRLAGDLPGDMALDASQGPVPQLPTSPAASSVVALLPAIARVSQRLAFPLAVAASLLVAFFLPDNTPATHETFTTGSSEIRTVALADGSSLSLDAESSIEVTLDGNGRHVDLLAGRVFFEVSHDVERPFTIAADKLRVTVTGTAFTVSKVRNEVAVAVQSGSVQAVARTRAPESARLRAGDSFSLSRINERVVRSTVKPEDVAAWREGLLVAEGMALASLIELIDHHYTGTIRLSDTVLASKKITGVFDLNDPQTALRAIAGSQNARVERLPGDVLAILPN